jgi:hypothetical protein
MPVLDTRVSLWFTKGQGATWRPKAMGKAGIDSKTGLSERLYPTVGTPRQGRGRDGRRGRSKRPVSGQGLSMGTVREGLGSIRRQLRRRRGVRRGVGRRGWGQRRLEGFGSATEAGDQVQRPGARPTAACRASGRPARPADGGPGQGQRDDC